MNNGSKIPLPTPTQGKPIKYRAAVSRQPGEPLLIEEIEVDPPKIGEVRIKILCSSLCHSDLTFWNTSKQGLFSFPIIFGHEAVGIVESVGEDVEEVKEGEMVVPVFQSNCTECKDCKSSKSNKCRVFRDKIGKKGMPRDGTTRFRDVKGQALNHFFFVSSFSEYTVVDVHNVVQIQPHLPVHKAVLFGCGVPTGIGAAWNVADVDHGSTVAIFGLGTAGLALSSFLDYMISSVAEGSRLLKASKIIGIDLNPKKFEIAKKFGVTDFINPATCGDKAIHEGWKKTIILGGEKDGAPFKVNSYEIINGMSITGAVFGGLKPKSDIPMLIQKYLDKELHLDELISHEVSIEDINKAFDLLLCGECLRCLIWIDDSNRTYAQV